MDREGNCSFDLQVRNVAAALCIIINLFAACARPAKNRWLTTATCLAVVNAGFLIHGFLPRLWRLAFGEPSVPRAVADKCDWHAYVKSKIAAPHIGFLWKILHLVRLSFAVSVPHRTIYWQFFNVSMPMGLLCVTLFFLEGRIQLMHVLQHISRW